MMGRMNPLVGLLALGMMGVRFGSAGPRSRPRPSDKTIKLHKEKKRLRKQAEKSRRRNRLAA